MSLGVSTPGRIAMITKVMFMYKDTQGSPLSADRQRMSLHHFLIICQKVIINAFQRLHGLLVSFWAVSPAVTSVAEVLHEDQDL